MSAVLTRRRTGRARDRDAYRQASLFGQVVAPPPREVVPPSPREVAVPEEPAGHPAEEIRVARAVESDGPAVAAPTLDAAISALWEELAAGEVSACPVCGDDLEPQHSAADGAAIVGGRCGTCAATLA